MALPDLVSLLVLMESGTMMFKSAVQILILVTALSSTASAQNNSMVTEAGAAFMNGTLSFASQGGDLYSYGSDRSTAITLGPRILYFVKPRVALGGTLDYTRLSQGSGSYTTLGVGPNLAYFFDSGGDVVPFLIGGVNYLRLAEGWGFGGFSEAGSSARLGGGLVYRYGHLAFTFEGNLILDRFSGTTGNTVFLSCGVGGFLF